VKRSAASLLIALAVGACATHTEAPAQAPGWDALDHAVGIVVDVVQQGQYVPYEDGGLGEYVTEVGRRVAGGSGRAPSSFRFTVVDSAEVSAWSTSGGFVYVSRSAIAGLASEAELAAVLAHEIAHTVLRHSAHTSLALTLKLEPGQTGALYDAEQEQADQLAMTLLERAGYDPRAVVSALRRLFAVAAALAAGNDPGDAVDGLGRLVRASRALDGRGGGEIGAAEFARRIDGVLWGSNPALWRMVGATFVCARCGFALDLPSGWKIDDQSGDSGSFAAEAPEGESSLRLARYSGAEAVRKAVMQQVADWHLTLRSVGTTTATTCWAGTGPEGAVAVLWSDPGDGGLWDLVVKGPGAEQVLDRVLASVRYLPATGSRGLRLRRRTSTRSGSFQQVLEATCASSAMSSVLEAINGHAPADHVERGARIACIEPS
jgi:hypothetical protein